MQEEGVWKKKTKLKTRKKTKREKKKLRGTKFRWSKGGGGGRHVYALKKLTGRGPGGQREK